MIWDKIEKIKLLLGIAVADRKYNIKIFGRGEEMTYSDDDIELYLETTHYNGHRLYCENTIKDDAGSMLLFKKRKSIIENLCDYFDTKKSPCIFVLDETDKDRKELEIFFNKLISKGHKISVEYDSAEKREQAMDDMRINILKAGKGLSINGIKIENIDAYWRWKANI